MNFNFLAKSSELRKLIVAIEATLQQALGVPGCRHFNAGLSPCGDTCRHQLFERYEERKRRVIDHITTALKTEGVITYGRATSMPSVSLEIGGRRVRWIPRLGCSRSDIDYSIRIGKEEVEGVLRDYLRASFLQEFGGSITS